MVGGGFLWKMREKGKGVEKVEGGVGWGGLAKEPASQCAHVCQNYPLANRPLVSPQTYFDLFCLTITTGAT